MIAEAWDCGCGEIYNVVLIRLISSNRSWYSITVARMRARGGALGCPLDKIGRPYPDISYACRGCPPLAGIILGTAQVSAVNVEDDPHRLMTAPNLTLHFSNEDGVPSSATVLVALLTRVSMLYSTFVEGATQRLSRCRDGLHKSERTALETEVIAQASVAYQNKQLQGCEDSFSAQAAAVAAGVTVRKAYPNFCGGGLLRGFF